MSFVSLAQQQISAAATTLATNPAAEKIHRAFRKKKGLPATTTTTTITRREGRNRGSSNNNNNNCPTPIHIIILIEV
eukprot:CAMPEP_0170791906 /NCGR_PEP_ID=MMETSP0733-20121128/21471_1 /TAXON_ID=186038 /ORGANISM="Fragilariopsis kerguelensis, Strain L26-C5" /LENGTH=76 /DNA_ID=CAMNT_0011140021 /DNA_START=331 /DNA_END=561 /DNA_ORIENTATION=-